MTAVEKKRGEMFDDHMDDDDLLDDELKIGGRSIESDRPNSVADCSGSTMDPYVDANASWDEHSSNSIGRDATVLASSTGADSESIALSTPAMHQSPLSDVLDGALPDNSLIDLATVGVDLIMSRSSAPHNRDLGVTPLKSSTATAVVDSKTITRPKRAPLPEAVVAPLKQNQTDSTSIETVMTAPPADPAVRRERRRGQTLASEITALFESAQQSMTSKGISTEAVDDLQQRVLSVLNAKEQEWAKMTDETVTTTRQLQEEHATVIAEYERTVQQLMRKINDEGAGATTSSSINVRGGDELIRERDQLREDNNSLEASYSDLFRRYERLREGTGVLKQNEEAMKRIIEELKVKNQRLNDRYNRLHEQADEQLEKANNEVDRMGKKLETDTLALRAKLKQRDAQIEAMELGLEAKKREIEELTNICDELINKAATGD